MLACSLQTPQRAFWGLTLPPSSLSTNKCPCPGVFQAWASACCSGSQPPGGRRGTIAAPLLRRGRRGPRSPRGTQVRQLPRPGRLHSCCSQHVWTDTPGHATQGGDQGQPHIRPGVCGRTLRMERPGLGGRKQAQRTPEPTSSAGLGSSVAPLSGTLQPTYLSTVVPATSAYCTESAMGTPCAIPPLALACVSPAPAMLFPLSVSQADMFPLHI